MLRAVSIIVAPALHTIFVTVRSRLSTYHHLRPSVRTSVGPSVRPSIVHQPRPPPARFFRPASDRRPIFSRERRFFSALLPEPQNGAKMRYRFAEPGLATDRSADLVRASIPYPLASSSTLPYPLLLLPSVLSPVRIPSLWFPGQASPSAKRFFSISILCSRDERRSFGPRARARISSR